MTTNHNNDEDLDDECPSCGSSSEDRAKREDYQGLHKCPHCGGKKCSMCDMGDDVECLSCD